MASACLVDHDVRNRGVPVPVGPCRWSQGQGHRRPQEDRAAGRFLAHVADARRVPYRVLITAAGMDCIWWRFHRSPPWSVQQATGAFAPTIDVGRCDEAQFADIPGRAGAVRRAGVTWGPAACSSASDWRGSRRLRWCWGRMVAGALVLVAVTVTTRQRLPDDSVVWAHLGMVSVLLCVAPFLPFACAAGEGDYVL